MTEEIQSSSDDSEEDAAYEEYLQLFTCKLGLVTEVTAKIHIDSPAQPKFYQLQSVPCALGEKVGRENDHLVETGVLEPVQHSDWAAPIYCSSNKVY